MHPEALPLQPGQESVWSYPRPPRLEPTSKHLQIIFNGEVLADTRQAFRVLETSHPPVYYIPPADIQQQYLIPSARSTFCEWKGAGNYYSVVVGEKQALDVGWYYAHPTVDFAAIATTLPFMRPQWMPAT